jgi:hypothetical protein
VELRAALLADAAYVSATDNKLFIHGGGWDRLYCPAFPATHPSLALVLLLHVEYSEALDAHRLEVILEHDGEPLGPRAEATMNVGHPPGTAPGAPTSVPFVVTFAMLTFDGPGRLEWVIVADGEDLGRVPLELVAAPPQPLG